MQASDAIKAPKRFPFMRSLTQVSSLTSDKLQKGLTTVPTDRLFERLLGHGALQYLMAH